MTCFLWGMGGALVLIAALAIAVIITDKSMEGY